MTQAQMYDEKVVALAKNYQLTEREILSSLVQMRKKKLFAELDYKGVFSYCQMRLKLSDSQCFYFQKVAEKVDEVPALVEAVVQGEISLSQARRITTVVTQQNLGEWIAKTRDLKQKDLEREVTKVNPRAFTKERLKPISETRCELNLSLRSEMERELRKVQNLESQRLKRPATLEDCLEVMTKEYLQKHDPVKKAERALSSRKVQPVTQGRRPLPAGLKHQVHLRDQFQCTEVNPDGKRCEEQRWLDLHHLVPIHQGGKNELDNLTTVCKFHHRQEHRERLRNHRLPIHR